MLIIFLARAFAQPVLDLVGTVATVTGEGKLTKDIIRNNSYTSYTEIIIKEPVNSIGSQAFSECKKVMSIVIPKTVLSIDLDSGITFRFLSSLQQIIVSGDNSAYSSDDQGILYDKEKTVLIRAPNKASITIPSTVTTLSSQCFQGVNSLTALHIPKSVTTINSGAMYDTSYFPEVTFESGIEIKEFLGEAFAYSQFESIEIPKSVRYLRKRAFMNTNLKTITFETGSNLIMVEEHVFFRCNVRNIVFPEGTVSLSSGTFTSCNFLTSVSIPASVTDIDQNSFSGCPALSSIDVSSENQFYSTIDGVLFNKNQSLLIIAPATASRIYIPAETKEVGKTPIQACVNIKEIEVNPNNTVFSSDAGVLYSKNYSTCIAVAGGVESVTFREELETIQSYSLYGCSKIKKVYFNGTKLKTVMDNSFNLCTNLTKIDLGTCEDLQSYAFASSSVEVVTFSGKKLKSLGSYVFENSGLRKIELPNTLENFAACTFVRTKSLKNITFDIDCPVMSTSYECFMSCNELESIILPKNIEIISEKTFIYCQKLSSVDISLCQNLQQILKSSFADTAITSFVVQNTVIIISELAFAECRSLSTFSFQNCSVKSIEAATFQNCIKLRKIYLHESVFDVSVSSFSGCAELISIECSEDHRNFKSESGILYSSNYSLMICPAGLQKATISKNIRSISQNAFYKCLKLTTIEFSEETENFTELKTNSFIECSALETVIFPGSLIELSFGSFVKCTAIKSISFGKYSNLTEIKSSMFVGFNKLENISFGEKSELQKIGSNSFKDCINLKSVIIPISDSINLLIEESAFRGCICLSRFDFNRVASIGSSSFKGCGLIEINITHDIHSFGPESFFQNPQLKIVNYCGKSRVTAAAFDTGVVARVTRNYVGTFSNCVTEVSIDENCALIKPPTAEGMEDVVTNAQVLLLPCLLDSNEEYDN